MFSAHSSGCFWCGKAPGCYFPPLQVHRGAQVLSYFCTQSSEVCAATELAEERRSFAFRRASLSYFTLILSDSHAVGFIVRRAFLELLHQAFLWGEGREARTRRQKCSRFIVPRELCHARVWSLLFPPRGLFVTSRERGLDCLHAPGQRCQREEWSYRFCCWVENGENSCLGAILCSAFTCSAELLQGATFCCFSPLCFLWQLPKCCSKTASGELGWHSHLPPYWCWFKGSEKKAGLKSDWVCLASRETAAKGDGNNFREVSLEPTPVAGLRENEKGVCFEIFQTQTKSRLPLACCQLDKFLVLVKADKEIVSQRWGALLHVRAAGRRGWRELDLPEPAEERWLAFSLTLAIAAQVPASPYALSSCSAPTGGQEPQVGEEEEEGSTKAEVQHCLGKFFRGVKTVKAYKKLAGKTFNLPSGYWLCGI